MEERDQPVEQLTKKMKNPQEPSTDETPNLAGSIVPSWECSDADTSYIIKQLRSWTTRKLQQLRGEATTPSGREAVERKWQKWQSKRKGKNPLGVVARCCARILPDEEWVPRTQAF
jgi:hypothetical protein